MCATGNTLNQQCFAAEVLSTSEALGTGRCRRSQQQWDLLTPIVSHQSLPSLQWPPLPLGLCNIPESYSRNYKHLATFTWMVGWAVTSCFSRPARGRDPQKPVLLAKQIECLCFRLIPDLSNIDELFLWDLILTSFTESRLMVVTGLAALSSSSWTQPNWGQKHLNTEQWPPNSSLVEAQ